MLEPRDLEAIELLLEKSLLTNHDKMKKVIHDEITKSESFLLDEMERLHGATEKKIETMQKQIDNLTQYYRIEKLENDNTTLLLQMITRLQEDVEVLKKKIA